MESKAKEGACGCEAGRVGAGTGMVEVVEVRMEVGAELRPGVEVDVVTEVETGVEMGGEAGVEVEFVAGVMEFEAGVVEESDAGVGGGVKTGTDISSVAASLDSAAPWKRQRGELPELTLKTFSISTHLLNQVKVVKKPIYGTYSATSCQKVCHIKSQIILITFTQWKRSTNSSAKSADYTDFCW